MNTAYILLILIVSAGTNLIEKSEKSEKEPKIVATY
jgi:hypothetical protein